MMSPGAPAILLQNRTSRLQVELWGGAITDFHLADGKLNPLTFAFTKEDMPENNKKGAPYQGHFICLGRWGEPSAGEKKLGLCDHGEFSNIMWREVEHDQKSASMEAVSRSEGLKIERRIRLDENFGIFHTSEVVTNINPLGRLYNMVQHPTIAKPFLTPATKISCNAGKGFHYDGYNNPEKISAAWPTALYPYATSADLRFSEGGRSGVHSYIVNQQDELGWITAFSPEHHLLLGYIWLRKDYPWINLWCDYQNDEIRYRGLEFGTSGIHQSFDVILGTGNIRVFGEPVVEFIDAGQSIKKQYLCFLHSTSSALENIRAVTVKDKRILIYSEKEDVVQLPINYMLE